MKYRMYLRAALLSSFLALAAFAPAQAQEHPNVARGFNPSGAFAAGGLDTINQFNGNLMIDLPLGQSYPVNAGLSYRLNLVYNSQVWEHQSYDTVTQAIPSRVANAGLGWMVSLGRLNPPQFLGDFDTFRNTYMSPDGARHTFYPTLHEGEIDTGEEAGIEYTRDGSYLRFNVAANQVEFPDGTIHTFDASGFPTQIRERFENQVNICYSTTCGAVANSWRISDSQGRVHWVYFKDTWISGYQPQVVDRVDVAAFNGARAVYTFRYNIDDSQFVIATGCRNNDPQTANLSVVLLTSLSLPDGTVYSMPVGDYFTAATTPCKAGMINRLTLPTLGKIEWDYITYTFPNHSSSRPFRQMTTGVGTRRLKDELGNVVGTWTYTTSLTPPDSFGAPQNELVNRATDPLGHSVTRYFSTSNGGEYGLPFSRRQAGDGTDRFLSTQAFHQNGTLLRSTYVRYERDSDYINNATLEDKTRLNQRLASQRTIFHDDGNLYTEETFSDFDGLGHYRSHSTGGNFPGSNVRTSAVGYNSSRGTYGQAGYTMWPVSSPWVLNTYSFSWESEGSQLLYRSYCFDSATGFLAGRRVHVANDSSYRTNDLVEVFARDTSGNMTSESYYGGDNRTISTDPTQGFICSLVNSLTSPSYRISHSYSRGVRATSWYTVGSTTLKVLDQTIDLSTGLASSSRDTAGIEERYTYDTQGRLTLAEPRGDPAISTDPTDVMRSVAYCTATSTNPCPTGVRGQVFVSQGGVNPPESRFRFDAWGRMISEEERMPPTGTYSKRSIEYNVMGWKTWVSAKGTAATGTTFKNFDAFGRPTLITPADGTAHNIAIAYAGTRQVARTVKVKTAIGSPETSATTTEVYDRFGRLHEVTEPNGTVTRYEYDAGNHLKRVCQAVTSTGVCGQERLFTYDNRGFLLWENHPEKTANIHGQSHDVDYSSYDARGHVLRKVDGDNDLSFQYDAAERLTLVRETGTGACVTTDNETNPSLCLKSFTYANSNGTNAAGLTDYRKGKLTSASRYNYVGVPYNSTVEIKETYEHTGRSGRVSQKDTYQIYNGTTYETFRQTFSWNDMGALASQTYPDCIASTVCGASSPRSVSLGYNRGRLTSVSGFATSITYHPNGLLHKVSRSNGLSDYQDLDSSSLVRPAAISTLRDSDSLGLWNSGAYQYDGSGNVWTMGTAAYVYDSLNRVVSGTVYPGAFSTGTAHIQSYTYDNYGNVKDITTNGVLVSTQTATATNRLTGATYDRAGNMTGWSLNTYEYDAFNQIKRMVSGAEDWRYIYTADDERFWSARIGGSGSLWTLRDLEGKVLREYSAHLGWSSYRDYVYRGGTLLASADSSAMGGAVRHLHTDHLGTPRLVTDAMGNPATAKFHTYYPFGEEIAGTYASSYTDRMRFTGHERDLANITGQGDDLDYMHARHYNPRLGRFLSIDPAGGDRNIPQSWNRYQYVLNRPSRLIDPDGERPIDPTIANFLGNYFGTNVSRVQVFGGAFSRTLTRMLGAEAVTIGQRVFFSSGGWSDYLAKRASGIALAGHEVRHTLQYKELGIFGFLTRYAWQGIKAGGDPHKMALEIIGYEDEEAILEIFKDDLDLLQSIQDGSYEISYDLIFKEAPVQAGVFGGISFINEWDGELWIDGINLTGVFSTSSPGGR